MKKHLFVYRILFPEVFVKLDKNRDGSYQYIPAGVWELCLNGHKFAVCREVEEI